MRRLLPLLAALLFALPAWSQSPANADQLALRKLKDDLTTAVTKRDFDGTAKLMHQPFMATLVTQEPFTDMDGIKRYYEHLLTRAEPRIKDMALSADVDGPSQILTGTFAVNKGRTNERYVLADGRTFDMHGRWTAFSIKEPDGAWKVLAVHTGINFLDNPVMTEVEKGIHWSGGGGLLIGLVVGAIGGWLMGRRRRAA